LIVFLATSTVGNNEKLYVAGMPATLLSKYKLMLEKHLIKIAEQSTNRIEKGKFRYYYQCGDYKFYNGYLAHWYAKKTNSFPEFYVDSVIKTIKAQLKDKTLDLAYNYNHDFLKNLKSQTTNLQLFLSGGSDSATVLKEAVDCGVVFDEIVLYIYENIDNVENSEIKENALLLLETYKNSHSKVKLFSVTSNMLAKFYNDPLIYFKTIDFENHLPFFRQFWNQPHDLRQGTKVFGSDKPQLLYYNQSWYVVLLDIQLSSFDAVDPTSTINFWLDPGNIKSLLIDATQYRNYIINKEFNSTNNLQFFKLHNSQETIINRILPPNKEKHQKLSTKLVWNTKDQHALFSTVQQQDLKTLNNYFRAVDTFLSVFPDYRNRVSQDNKIFDAQIGWAINLDTLEVLSKQELIPNGFEL
jgi:hypothetical protein